MDHDVSMVNRMKEKYDLTRDKRVFPISSINDTTILFAAKVLSRKMLQKMRQNQCTSGRIAATKECVVGVQMNWETYLLNELLVDVTEA